MAGSSQDAATEPDRNERIIAADAIRELLRDAAHARSLCSVRPAGRPENYLARIIGFDSATGALSLEPPKVPYIERALQPGCGALIDIRDGERRATFESRVLRVLPGKTAAALVLEMPSAVVKPRRRESFRIGVPPDVPVLLTIGGQRGWTDLQVQNLSTDGALVSLTGSRERFEPGAEFDRSTLRLPGGESFELALRVRHASTVRLAGQASELRVGLVFIRTPPGFVLAIGKLVESIARMPVRPRA